MVNWNKFELERAREDAEIANIPNKVQHIAHVLLTNRALATCLLQIHTEHAKYTDICKFIDSRVRVLVEKAISLKAPVEPSSTDGDDDDSEERYPPRWEGDPKICSGKTQNGSTCTKRGTYSHEGIPYCRKHFPHSAEYRVQRTLREQRDQECIAQYATYFEEKRVILNEMREMDGVVRGLDDMNSTLTGAIKQLQMPMPEVAPPSIPKGPVEMVRIDGIVFRLEKVNYPGPSFSLEHDGQRLSVLMQRGEEWAVFDLDPDGWSEFRTGTGSVWETRGDAIRYSYLYNTFYKVRCRRDLSWFGSEVRALVSKRVELSSPGPLKMLCGLTVPSIGWHVFEKRRGENHNTFISVYSGHSEAEARWEYASRNEHDSLAALLISPSHKIVDFRFDGKLFW